MGHTKLCANSLESFFLFLCIFISWSVGLVSSANVPCAARQATAGYICVCNNTYCDTIERPKALKSGHFYHYTTSATQPGFNLETGSFTALDSSNSSFKFVVDASQTYQTFQGIGAGLSDSSAINFNILSTKLQSSFLQSFFGVKGVEYVFGRVPVGSTDFSTRYYTYDDVPEDINLTHFQLADEDFKLRIPMIKRANKVSKRGLQLLATPWTAPAWMKVNNASTRGYLGKEYESVYAQYLVRYFEEYKNQGLEFWGLSLGNELAMGFEMGFQMPNLILFPPQMKTWARDYLGPMMKSKFPEVKMVIMDDGRPFLQWYSRELLDDRATAQYIDGAGLHWYFDTTTNTYVLDDFYTKYPDKLLLYTESSIGGGPHANGTASYLGSWSNAEQYITKVIQNFNHFVSGFIDWNICLDEQGGPHQQMGLDSPVVVNATTGREFYKQPYFYALGHFSKFLPPGALRINVTSDQNLPYSHIFDDFVTGVVGGGDTPPSGATGQPAPGPGPTGQPAPTSAPSTDLVNVAAVNPDGSHTFIVYNPRSESVDITINDKQKGTITKTLGAQSLNTFLYW